MNLLQSPSIPSLRLPFLFPKPSTLSGNFLFFSKPSFQKIHPKSISFLALSSPNALPMTEQEILDALSQSDVDKEKNLPAVRFYENDLSRLTVIGDVNFEQALTAAAADGGETAEEHIASGAPTMVVETVFPGSPDERSTISTRLFLPANKVKEKARKLRNTLTADILASTTSRNILAMTFRQVVLERLWSFELVVFSPGTERNMADLSNPREVTTSFSLNSSDERILSVLAEAVCSCALESTKRDFLENTKSATPSNIFSWFQKSERIASSDSSVYIYKISEDEIIKNARNLGVNFNSVKSKYRLKELKPKDHWWMLSAYSRLENVDGPEFSAWASEYVPAYRLQIDTAKFKNVKIDGWEKSAGTSWEVLLTHFQMVGLANILDMYYEDAYTIPLKQLSCGLVADFLKLKKKKGESLLWKMLSITFASGCILVFASVLAQFYGLNLFRSSKFPAEHGSVSLAENSGNWELSLEATELEAMCISVIKRIKDALGWPGDVTSDSDIGAAWTGEVPSYLRRLSGVDLVQEAFSCNGESTTSGSSVDVPPNEDFPNTEATPSDRGNTYIEASHSDKSNPDQQTLAVQDIASYQVVLSKDGKIIGFQPTSRVAVNHWASNPLAKALYEGRKLSPGKG